MRILITLFFRVVQCTCIICTLHVSMQLKFAHHKCRDNPTKSHKLHLIAKHLLDALLITQRRQNSCQSQRIGRQWLLWRESWESLPGPRQFGRGRLAGISVEKPSLQKIGAVWGRKTIIAVQWHAMNIILSLNTGEKIGNVFKIDNAHS